MSDFDAIVVGSGCAGSVAALELAKRGKSVLVIERGTYAGAKNMTGGRIYSHALKPVFPDFEKTAPLERKVTHESISLIAPESNLTIDFSSEAMRVEGQDSYTVLRGPFDQWLAEQAEDAGAEYIYGIAVEGLLKEGERVTGVHAGGDEITADLVLLCDGVNSLLTREAVGFKTPEPHTMAVGIKQTIELPASVIEDRMQVSGDEGRAWLFAGDSTHGHIGGGFLYSNKESISLGLVATISDLMTAETPVYQMLEDFKAHPVVAPLIKGGKVVEHSGHMVPEGGLNMMPELTGDGVLLAGESAMMCVNIGYQVRGMDFAIAAGMIAGRKGADALDANDTSKERLKGYVEALEDSFVMRELRQYRNFPHFMETTTRIFNEYPETVGALMNDMFIVDGAPAQPLGKMAMGHLKKIGYLNLLKDLRGGVKAL